MEALKTVDDRPLSSLTFIDVGSGLGHIVRMAASSGFSKSIGIEASPLHAWLSKILIWKQRKNSNIIVGDAFTSRLMEGDVIYYFLTSRAMPRLTTVLRQHAKPGTVVIGLGNELLDWKPCHQFTASESGATVFFYRV